MIQRRQFLAASILAIASTRARVSDSFQKAARSVGYGFSLYGMKKLPLAEALKSCAELGYDCVELPTMADWPGAPEKLDAEARRTLRGQLRDHSLRLSAMMENVTLLADPAGHQKNLDRLRAAGELGHELSAERPPLIETIMGGRPENWDAVKKSMAERLGSWADTAKACQTVVAIKAHVSGAAHRPEHIRWLLDQVRSPWLKAVYDFSHFQLRQMSLRESFAILASDTVFIHIKDAIGDDRSFRFVLPGDGMIDYVDYFRMLRESQCAADVVVEVSGQLHGAAGYDPLAAAKKSYAAIAPAFEKAELPRAM